MISVQFMIFIRITSWYIILNQMKLIFLIMLLCWLGHAGYYCRSKCSANSNAGCRFSGPLDCTNCFSTYYTSCTVRTTFTLVEEAIVTNLTSTWNISTVNPALTCSYTSSFGWTFTYNFYATLVGGDYVYRTVPITTPHYRLSIRFSIAFIGVWTVNNDYLNLYTADTIQNRT